MIFPAHRIHCVDSVSQDINVFLCHVFSQHGMKIIRVKPHDIIQQRVIMVEIHLRDRDGPGCHIPGYSELQLLGLHRFGKFYHIVNLIVRIRSGLHGQTGHLCFYAVFIPVADPRISLPACLGSQVMERKCVNFICLVKFISQTAAPAGFIQIIVSAHVPGIGIIVGSRIMVNRSERSTRHSIQRTVPHLYVTGSTNHRIDDMVSHFAGFSCIDQFIFGHHHRI